jgi:quinol monooxygenase YgiN
MPEPCQIIELRQYQLHADRRDDLIDLFDTHLVEPQEEVGMHVVGQFRDLDRPDRFVWFRGYADMPSRLSALTAFYLKSEAWARHRDAANATMIDSDDVLLLNPMRRAGYVCDAVVPRAAAGQTTGAAEGIYTLTIHHLSNRPDEAADVWQADVPPALQASGTQLVAAFRSEHAPNNFPRLPVREDAEVLIALVRHDSHASRRASTAQLEADPAYAAVDRRFARYEQAPRETLLLEPTLRSELR